MAEAKIAANAIIRNGDRPSQYPKPNDWHGKVAIVTGASSGIGAAIATQLVEEGLRVVGFARRMDRLQELVNNLIGKKGALFAQKVDITNEEEILRAIKWTVFNIGNVHMLVNCAGVYTKSPLINGDLTKWQAVINTNVIGLCICTREIIQNMIANNNDGLIIHINSVAGHYIFPNINIYGASKFALTNLTESLRQELVLIKSKIKISSISPGLVDTEMINKDDLMESDYISSLPKLAASDIADAVIYIMKLPAHIEVQDMIIRPVGDIC